MKARCQDEVEAHLGRSVTAAEVKQIEDRIGYHLRHVKAEAPEKGWSTADTLREAGRRAGDEVRAESVKTRQRVAAQIDAAARRQQQYAELKAVWGPTKALGRMLEQSASYISGVKADAFRRVVSVVEAVEPGFFGMLENAGATRDFIREVYGRDMGNAKAKRAAEGWLKGREEQRVRANRAGFNIGKLDYGYVPRAWAPTAMFREGREAFVADALARADRSRYLNDDGSHMTDLQLAGVLDKSFDTITMNGWNKIDPTDYHAAGARANRGSAHRELHFAGPDAELEMMNKYGRGTLWDAMRSHVANTAGSIGLVEQYGPNPQAHFDALRRQSIKDNNGVEKGYGLSGVRPFHQWEALSGNAAQTLNPRMAEINQSLRDVNVMSKLGSTFLGVGNDAVSMATTALFNRMPAMRTLGAVFSSLGKEKAKFAAEAGLAVQSIIGDMHVLAAENMLSKGFTSKLANATMKASLLEGWTHIGQRAFSMSMMHMLADLTKTDWEHLAPGDLRGLTRWSSGVTAEDWRIWQKTPRQIANGSEIIHPEDMRAPSGSDDATIRAHDRAASSLLGYIASQAGDALVIPNNYTQAALIRGLKKGTVEGEAIRHVALFKGYSAAILNQYFGRIAELDMSRAGKAGLMIAFAGAMTMLGAVTQQLKAIRDGKDPVDMTGPHAGKFWAAAFFQGGGSGIMGDLVNQAMSSGTPAQQAANVSSAVLGPVFGSGLDLTTATLGELGKKARGEKTDFGAKMLQFGRSNTPLGAPTNLWYTKAAVDHMFFHELQEAASPGYLSRMQQRAQKDYGQGMWWKPGNVTPDRAPNMEKAFGGP